jgi:hypothetical protein
MRCLGPKAGHLKESKALGDRPGKSTLSPHCVITHSVITHSVITYSVITYSVITHSVITYVSTVSSPPTCMYSSGKREPTSATMAS